MFALYLYGNKLRERLTTKTTPTHVPSVVDLEACSREDGKGNFVISGMARSLSDVGSVKSEASISN